MPRPPRLQFPGAIYHIVNRGDGRRVLFHDDGHCYVVAGLSGAPENPPKSALREWVIGSHDFLKRMVVLAEGQDEERRGSLGRRMGVITVEEVVADVHQIEPEEYVGFRSMAAGREMAALLYRRHTAVTLAGLFQRFGLRHPDSSANLVRREKKQEERHLSYRRQIARAESQLARKTENQV